MSKGSKFLVILTGIFILFTVVTAIVLSLSAPEVSISKGTHPTANPTSPATPQKLNINTATADQLTALPGIGDGLARAIVDYRAEHGPFRSIGELTNISGIGSSKLEAIADLITVGG